MKRYKMKNRLLNSIGILVILLCLLIPSYSAEPLYVVTFELYQTNYTLSISTHLRNHTNKVEFQIPVDKSYYDSIQVGQNVMDNFRVGSAFFKGSFGSWKMKVKNKNVVYK